MMRLLEILLVLAVGGGVIGVAEAQARRNATRPVTDPVEARAINSIFAKWRISAGTGWNISGELCSGIASDNVTALDFSPGIKCDCYYDSGTTCHIYALRVYSMSDWNSSSSVVGPLPEELWNLTYLVSLNLGQNYLQGPLSASVGKLTRLQYLSLSINSLSGKLPKELGKLTDLRSLAISTNNFSGSLPSELGKCTRLEELWIDSSGVSGPIPSTFRELKKMRTVFASDTALTGRIPDFIGSWSKLTTLRFQGNSFDGPIPSFSNLTALADLRISDLSSGGSPLHFLVNMTSLTTLILRNNKISGSIPSNIIEYRNLSFLDLSFNSLAGRIPDSLFNLSSLVHLFLGSNKLTGPMPAQKSSILQYIDLSYNELSGSFPSWVNQQDLHLNLVANNFTIEGSNSSSVLPSGLNCLQRNFPCYRGDPQYSTFAIKCGGRQVRSAAGIVHEADNETLGPATYYVSRERRWAVSNVGLPMESPNPEFETTYLNYFPNTRDPELFQSSRLSAGSLRYYGLGLQNGGYNVRLHFVESKFENDMVWKSLGRRIFDIYIQGNLVWKDFDIRKEAGRASYKTVEKFFSARVSENHLEIHLFWAGKGTCCVPAHGTYGPSISAISVSPADFNPTVSNNPQIEIANKKNRSGMIVGIVVSIGFLSLLSLLFAIYYLVQRRKRQKSHEDEAFLGVEARPYTFGYAELRAATDDFSTANKLGEGGFGVVYKGTLEDGRIVAVKQLSIASHHGRSQFVAEIATISAVQHRNLVKLYGCCIEGDKWSLVYEYLENKSLDQALFGNRSLRLKWPARFGICLGVARGLAYLHEESRLRIVHRDVKPSNILLDSELNPKISDFGLAKLYDYNKTHMSTRIAGTIGYLAPEYAMRGHLTEKADVFGFGVVTLEVVSGRASYDSRLEGDRKYLLEWAWRCHENNQEMDMVDPDLFEFNEDEAQRVIAVALLCIQTSPVVRPSMSRVVAMLSGDVEVPTVTTRPGYLSEWNLSDTSTFFMDNGIIDPVSVIDLSPYDASTMTPPPQCSPLHDPVLEGAEEEIIR